MYSDMIQYLGLQLFFKPPASILLAMELNLKTHFKIKNGWRLYMLLQLSLKKTLFI